MPVLMFVNLKGGVAKTTNAVAVAECLADMGHPTLVIDADHQCAASELLLGEQRANQAEKRQATLHDLLAAMLDDEFDTEQIAGYVLKGGSDVRPVRQRLDVLPCSVRIDDFQTNMAKGRRGFPTTEEFHRMWGTRRRQLKRWASRRYSYTIIDCPPSLPVQVRFLLRVVDGYIVPSIPDRLSVRGSLWLQERLAKLPSPPPALGTLWTLYREQNQRHRHIVELVRKRIPRFAALPRPFQTVIPNSTDIVRAVDGGDGATFVDRYPTFQAKYTLKFARLYESLAREIIVGAAKLMPDKAKRAAS